SESDVRFGNHDRRLTRVHHDLLLCRGEYPEQQGHTGRSGRSLRGRLLFQMIRSAAPVVVVAVCCWLTACGSGSSTSPSNQPVVQQEGLVLTLEASARFNIDRNGGPGAIEYLEC